MSAQPLPENTATFTVEEILRATGGRPLVRGLERGTCVASDTRFLKTGAIFVALRGERFDAHRFLERAVQAGAQVLVVEDVPETHVFVERVLNHSKSRLGGPSVIMVRDTLRALGDLALAHRLRNKARIVAVVGSAGKTTTRSVVSSLLEVALGDRVHSTAGNFNNRVGVPLTVLGLEERHEVAVIELGTNTHGEIAELSRIVRPDLAVMTLIDLEHTEGLGDLDGVEAEERAVFDSLDPSGVAIGYGDDERVLRSVLSASGPKHLLYGERAGWDVQITSRSMISPDLAELKLLRRVHGPLTFHTKLIGRAGALAAAAGVTVTECLLQRPLTAEECELATNRAGEPGRHSLLRLANGIFIVDDSYNSNPASVENSLRTGHEIAHLAGGRLWLVLGEMLELGTLSISAHRRMGALIDPARVAGVFFVQGAAKYALDACNSSVEVSEFVEDSSLVVPMLVPLLGAGDVVVVKASRGVRAERVVEGLVNHFGLERASATALPLSSAAKIDPS